MIGEKQENDGLQRKQGEGVCEKQERDGPLQNKRYRGS